MLPPSLPHPLPGDAQQMRGGIPKKTPCAHRDYNHQDSCLQNYRHSTGWLQERLQEQLQVLHSHHSGQREKCFGAAVRTFRTTTKAAEVYQVWLLYSVL